MVGERQNITGSAKFRRLIESGDYQSGVDVALEQVRSGANLIDVNMDADLLDSEKAMTTFLNLVATEPEIARVPIMVDSSKWSVIEAGLKCIQGKGVVNSISLKEGEADFLEKARRIKRYGAAVVVMAFDETGPGRHRRAQDRDLRTRVPAADRGGRLRPVGHHLRPQHPGRSRPAWRSTTSSRRRSSRRRARSSGAARACNVSGGVSNLSFSFRGNEPVRQAIHSAFLYHAIAAGLDMAIVNAGPAPGVRRHPEGPAGARRGHHLRPPSRRDRADGRRSPRP